MKAYQFAIGLLVVIFVCVCYAIFTSQLLFLKLLMGLLVANAILIVSLLEDNKKIEDSKYQNR